MAVITDLLDEFATTDRSWGPRVTFNPPPTQAEWDRFALVHPDVEFPDDLVEFFSFGNGISTGHGNLLRDYSYPGLPIEPPEVVALPAPCPMGKQVLLVTSVVERLFYLLDGPHRGEVWNGWISIFDVFRTGRVAWSLEHFLAQCREVGELPEGKMDADAPFAEHGVLPAGQEIFTMGKDWRGYEERSMDGGRPEYYIPEVDPRHETVTFELWQDEYDLLRRWQREWRERHFPGDEKTPRP